MVASSSNGAPVLESTNVLLALSWGNEDNEKSLKLERGYRPEHGLAETQSDSRLPRKAVLGSFPLKGKTSRFR